MILRADSKSIKRRRRAVKIGSSNGQNSRKGGRTKRGKARPWNPHADEKEHHAGKNMEQLSFVVMTRESDLLLLKINSGEVFLCWCQ